MRDILLNIALYIIIPTSFAFLLTWIDKKSKGTKYEKFVDSVIDIVHEIELSTAGKKLGNIKKTKAMEISKQLADKFNISLNEEEISQLIEKAVKEMNELRGENNE
jgi:hypothetical protein